MFDLVTHCEVLKVLRNIYIYTQEYPHTDISKNNVFLFLFRDLVQFNGKMFPTKNLSSLLCSKQCAGLASLGGRFMYL